MKVEGEKEGKEKGKKSEAPARLAFALPATWQSFPEYEERGIICEYSSSTITAVSYGQGEKTERRGEGKKLP